MRVRLWMLPFVASNILLVVGSKFESTLSRQERDNVLSNFDPTTNRMLLATNGSIHNRTLIEPDYKAVSYTHLRAHETPEHLVCRLLLEKKKNQPTSAHNRKITRRKKRANNTKKINT